LRDESGKYKLIIVIRNDRYEVDENKRVIHLKDFKLSLKFKGKLSSGVEKRQARGNLQ
jgi:putative transposase